MNQVATIAPVFDFNDDLSRIEVAIKENYVRHPRLELVEQDLRRLLKYGVMRKPLVTSTCVYLLTGSAGCGKTTILKQFRDSHPSSLDGPDGDTHPVLYVEVPPDATRKALADAILDELGARTRPRNITGPKLFALLLHHLREQKVRMLILDEAHGFVDRRSKRVNYDGAEWLKSLLNACICPVVISGCPDAELVYIFNDQLERRSFGSRRLEPFRYTEDLQWQSFCAVVEALLQDAPVGLDAKHDFAMTCMALHHVSEGHLGRLVDFLAIAFINAVEGGHATLEPAFSETAEQRAPSGRGRFRNPFGMEVGELHESLVKADARRFSELDYGPAPEPGSATASVAGQAAPAAPKKSRKKAGAKARAKSDIRKETTLRRGNRGPTLAEIGC
jgi:hypothetical protein